MSSDEILTSEEEAALEEAAKEFNRRNYSLYNHRVRPNGVSIFEWLSSDSNAEAFKKGQEVMKKLELSNA